MDFIQPLVLLARQQPVVGALLAIGAFTAAKSAFKIISTFLQIFLLPGISLKRFRKKGSWAVVTGATDGIGKEFAFQLAKAGFNILLVARNQVVLDSTASEIAKKYPGSTTSTHAIDFSKNDDAAYAQLSASLDGLDVGVLVNNVGKSHAMPTYFIDTPKEEITDIVSINVNATIWVTYAVLPGMVRRKGGLILNLGSFAGAVASPMLATYSGTKAFLATFTSALAEEVKKDNVVVEHVNAYFIVSKLSKIRRPSAMVPVAGPFVRSVLAKVGLAGGAAYSSRPNTSTPYWSHAILDWFMHWVNIPSLFISYTHTLNKDTRRRALKKAEREAKAQ